jgi:muramoyltetrapeptide carboxypeptidase
LNQELRLPSILPPRLQAGDTIGLVSPSTPVLPQLEEQYLRGVDELERMGFHVLPGEHIRSTSWGYAASPQEKAADINRMFADPAVRAILCTQGGMTANACLPFLDWDLIRTHPKIFIGISDITVLLNAIFTRTGLITFHAADLLWGFGRGSAAYELDEFRARLVEGRTGLIPANGPRQCIRPGTAEGRLLGGNIRCLLNLAGTTYWPDFTDAILFVEALDITPEKCDYMFQQLKQIGVFDRLRGAVVGYNDFLQRKNPTGLQMEDVLLRVTAEYNFPILKVNDFGHNCPNTVLPVGGTLRVDANAATLEITDSFVS